VNLTLSPARAAAIRLWILIPARTNSCLAPHHITLLGMLRSHSIWYSLRTLPGDSLITRARNNLADIFYRESTDDDNHLALWLDDDIFFNPESILQLLALSDRYDFLSAPYSRKGLHMDRMHAAATLGWKSTDIESVAGTPNVNYLVNAMRLDEPTPVLEAGSGFWLHRRKVLRMMADSLPHIRYRRTPEEIAHYGSDHAHDFFRVGVWPETGEYLSEDWWFCREWRNLGGTVHCCFWVPTHHLGQHMYPMNMDAVIGLLNATGGYLHGPTWPTKETTNAEIKAPSNGTGTGTGGTGANGDATRARVGRGPIIQSARLYSPPPSQAAVEGDPSPLGV
jgi:hypothetical protein